LSANSAVPPRRARYRCGWCIARGRLGLGEPERCALITARSCRLQTTSGARPASFIHVSRSSIRLGKSYPSSFSMRASAGFSGTTTSPITKRPPGARCIATSRKSLALWRPSRWWIARAETTMSKVLSGIGSRAPVARGLRDPQAGRLRQRAASPGWSPPQ
jgi:hypothetical protein